MAATDLDDVPDRLALLKSVADFETDAAFAEKLGFSPQRWNNFLRGTPLSRDAAITLCRAIPGLTLDWLYFAKTEGLTVDVLRRIEAARKGRTPSRKGREAR